MFEFTQAPATETPPIEIAEKDLPDPRAEKRERKKTGGRKPLPKELPRERRNLEIPEAERLCRCCGRPMEPFGQEVSEEIDHVP